MVNTFFEQLPTIVGNAIAKARYSIQLAVPQLTDTVLLHELVKKSFRDVNIDLILTSSESHEQQNAFIKYLQRNSVNIYALDTPAPATGFAIIDYETVITGTYSWSYRQNEQVENLILIQDREEASKFLQQFEELRQKSFIYPGTQKDDIEIALTANRTIAEAGQTVRIQWEAINAADVRINLLGSVENQGMHDLILQKDELLLLEATHPATGRKKNKALFLRVLRNPLIVEFKSSEPFTSRTGKVELSWDVKHAESVFIDQGIGEVALKGNKIVIPSDSKIYTLTAKGMTGNVSRSVTVNVFPTPVLEKIKVPTPVNIRIEASFDRNLVDLPSGLKLGETFLHRQARFPKLVALRSEGVPDTPTVNDLSRALNIPRRELFDSLGKPRNRLTTALFKGLARLFRNDPRISDVINTIRKHYE